MSPRVLLVFVSLLIAHSSSYSPKSFPVKLLDRSEFISKASFISSSLTFGASKSFGAEQSPKEVEGYYSDPNHPNGYRLLILADNNKAIVEGSDNGPISTGKEWVLQAVTKGSSLFIDFTPKGYPKTLEGKFDGSGIVFPDGNRWVKFR